MLASNIPLSTIICFITHSVACNHKAQFVSSGATVL